MTMENRKLTQHQSELIQILVTAYDLDEKEILFFDESTDPFFTYNASCLLINQLVNPRDIQNLPFEAENTDSIARQIVITLGDGRTRSSVGVVNLRETIFGVEMSDAQRQELAAARGMRGTIRLFGLDLMKLHFSDGQVLDFKVKTNKASLLGQAHQLGKLLCWIVGTEKSAWYIQLKTRYNVEHSNELSETQLSDFVAFMRGLLQPQKLAA